MQNYTANPKVASDSAGDIGRGNGVVFYRFQYAIFYTERTSKTNHLFSGYRTYFKKCVAYLAFMRLIGSITSISAVLKYGSHAGSPQI